MSDAMGSSQVERQTDKLLYRRERQRAECITADKAIRYDDNRMRRRIDRCDDGSDRVSWMQVRKAVRG